MFITDSLCISPQHTLDDSLFSGNWVKHTGLKYMAIEPDYSDYIPRGTLRRMGRGVRLAMGAGLPLLKKHPEIEGILVGTGNGGLDSAHQFLVQLLEYEEGTLTPTQFVQGTPNTPAGQLAIANQVRGYNATHTHDGASFELCLLDGLMLMEEGQHDTLLIGAYEEVSEAPFNIDRHTGYIKTDFNGSEELLGSQSPGSIVGEGATFFVVNRNAEEYLAVIRDITSLPQLDEGELIHAYLSFLARNNLKPDMIDGLVLGYNGDARHAHRYDTIAAEHSNACGLFSFKNAFGESRTASALGIWLTAQLISGKKPPPQIVLRPPSNPLRRVVMYNHYYDMQHQFVLLSN